MSKLTVIISTYSDRVFLLENILQDERPDVRYLVVHQQYQEIDAPSFLDREDVEVVQTDTKGLSKSRNVGLSHCTTPYALIADDDVRYLDNSFDLVIESLESGAVDIAVFKIKTLDGEPQYKQYVEEDYLLNQGARHWVSSVELAFNVESVKSKGIYFDERFGLGTYLKKGEEQLFVNDCMRVGLVCKFFNRYLVIHPFESSGKRDNSIKFLEFYSGAFANRNKEFRINFRRIMVYLNHPMLFIVDVYYMAGFIYIWVKKKR